MKKIQQQSKIGCSYLCPTQGLIFMDKDGMERFKKQQKESTKTSIS